jgi:hypothetical protein
MPRSTGRWLTAVLAVAASLSIGVSACSGGDTTGSSAIEAIAVHDWHPADPGMQALLTGTLDNRAGCLVVVRADTPEPVVAAFPRTLARWDAGQQVLEYGGREFHVGDTVWMAGGGVDVPLQLPEARELIGGRDVFFVQDTELVPPEQRQAT